MYVDPTAIETITRIISTAVTAAAALFAAFQYRRNVRTKRAEWLLSLFERFYERPTYRRIRAILDHGPHPSPEFARLESDVQNGNEAEDVEAFVNYLNFFEFIAVLWKHGQIAAE